MPDADILPQLLSAGLGDGITAAGKTYAIAAVGESFAAGGFGTREFTLGRDEDFYLVIEGPLDENNPDRCRAVLTHEVSQREVTAPSPHGKPDLVARLLQNSDAVPPVVSYHGRRYQFSRRVVARYASRARNGSRLTWDFESGNRNLAVERWPDAGEMAVYEGRTLPLDSLEVVRGYRRPSPPVDWPMVGTVLGWLMMIVGFFLMVF